MNNVENGYPCRLHVKRQKHVKTASHMVHVTLPSYSGELRRGNSQLNNISIPSWFGSKILEYSVTLSDSRQV